MTRKPTMTSRMKTPIQIRRYTMAGPKSVLMASRQTCLYSSSPCLVPLSIRHCFRTICSPPRTAFSAGSRPVVIKKYKSSHRSVGVSAVASDQDVKEAAVEAAPSITIAMVGRDGSGKTRLVAELMRLQNSGKKGTELSSLCLGQPSADQLTREEDSSHFNTTLYNHVYSMDCDTHKLQIVDCPGHIDRLPQVDMALRISGGGVFVVNMMDDVDDGAERVWQRVQEAGSPVALFISQLDLGGTTDFNTCISSIKDQFGVQPLVLQYPQYDDDGALVGLLDVLNGRMCIGDQGCLSSEKIPESAMRTCTDMLKAIIEALAESEVNEEIMDAYLDEVVPSPEVLENAVKEGITKKAVIPVLCGSSAKGMGADALAEFASRYFPPMATDPGTPSQWVTCGPNGSKEDLIPSKDDPFVGFVFGAHWDRYSGKCCDVMVLRGKLAPGQKYVQGDNNAKFSTQKLMRWSSVGKLEAIKDEAAIPGDLIVLDHCDDVQVNSTICDPKDPIVVNSLHFEKPRCTYKLDLGGGNPTVDEKILGALHKIIEEDPSIRLIQNEETSEFLLSGMGALHLEVVKERLLEDHGLELHLSTPHVAYHETVSMKVTAKGRHKKQSGGHGQFGEAVIEMEHLERGAGVQFVSKIKGGVIPSSLIRSVERGVREALKTGPLGGFPVVDVQITLVDGKTHSVDSGDASFFQAGILAVKEAYKKCGSVLLEPVMMVKADVPSKNTGNVSKDIARRRGQVIGMDANGHMTDLVSLVPLATMLGYSSDLQQMTAGLGCFTMELEKYQSVPSNLVKTVLEENSLTSKKSA